MDLVGLLLVRRIISFVFKFVSQVGTSLLSLAAATIITAKFDFACQVWAVYLEFGYS